MTVLVGYWGITNDQQMGERLRRISAAHRDATPHQVLGPGWSVTAFADNSASQHAIPIRCDGRNQGWLIGSLFGEIADGKMGPATGPLDTWVLGHEPGAGLAGQRWGRFALATVAGRDRPLILGRDALGLSRCYLTRVDDGFAFASHLATLVDLLGNRPAFDWTFLASWIHHGALPTPGTPFVGVRQVRPGALLRIDASGQSERFYWNPFRVASEPDETPCGEQVRETFEACVKAWTREARRVLVDLSGGLDSSAVAWTVRDHPAAVAAYLDCGTMACADEYDYALQVAKRFGLDLHRIAGNGVLPLTPVDTPARRWDAPSPHLLQRRLNATQTALGGVGALHLSGGGGDQVFYARLEAPHQLHDQLRARGLRVTARQAMAYSRREGVPLAVLLRQVVSAEIARTVIPSAMTRRVAFTMPAPGWLREPYRCADDCASRVIDELAAGTGRLAAGKARHAAEVAFANGMVDRDHRNPHGAPLAYPMLSVPLVEMALRTPTIALIDAERDRIVFRDAMASVLPEQVVTRQEKGDYTGMYQLGLRRNFQAAKELIVNGYAAAAGVIDATSAINDLRASALGHSQEMWPLQQLLAVESWCRAWS